MGRKILLTSLLLLFILCIGIDTAPNTQRATEMSTPNTQIPNTQSLNETEPVNPLLNAFFSKADNNTGERVSFDQVVTGDGKGEITGYYGWVINPDGKYWFSRHLYVRALSSADIHNIALLANASGYETVLVTEPLEYDPLPPPSSCQTPYNFVSQQRLDIFHNYCSRERIYHG